MKFLMYPISTLIIIVLFLSSCSLFDESYDCDPQREYVLDLTPDDKAGIPYNGYDSLKFVRTSISDTHTFIGTGIENNYTIGGVNNDINCPDDKANLEFIKIKFESQTVNEPIYFQVYRKSYTSSPDLLITFKNQTYSYSYRNLTFGKSYYDSIQIAGKYYYNVNFLNENSHEKPDVFYTLYNNLGILRIKLQNGETWDLISKK